MWNKLEKTMRKDIKDARTSEAIATLGGAVLILLLFWVLMSVLAPTSAHAWGVKETVAGIESKQVEQQHKQYLKGQPVPAYDFSLERHILIQLYNIRNQSVATHSVWRSNTGMIEGDCPSLGFSIPYDSSLTNPLAQSMVWRGGSVGYQTGTVEQPEPLGIYASKNTSATWVLCVGQGGLIDPIYVESKVTSYPYPLTVDYETDRVHKAGKSTVHMSLR